MNTWRVVGGFCVFLIFLAGWADPQLFASDGPPPSLRRGEGESREAYVERAFRQTLKEKKSISPNRSLSTLSSCGGRVLLDLTHGRFEIVKPRIRADSIDDPRLDAFRNICQAPYPFLSMGIGPDDLELTTASREISLYTFENGGRKMMVAVGDGACEGWEGCSGQDRIIYMLNTRTCSLIGSGFSLTERTVTFLIGCGVIISVSGHLFILSFTDNQVVLDGVFTQGTSRCVFNVEGGGNG